VTRKTVRRRFWLELSCGVLGAFLFLLTLITREWIELIFGVDPDQGSGALEWAIALTLLAVATLSFALAYREWKRPALA
jgi:hypothetical protein